MSRECDAVRILPEVVEMGPSIPIDEGLMLQIEPAPDKPGGINVFLAWDPRTPWGALGSMKPKRREKWMLQLVQNINRMVAEEMDGFELVMPRLGSSKR